MGGDCLNVGCVPSKALISAARVANMVRNSEAYGVEVSGYVTVNFGKVNQPYELVCTCMGILVFAAGLNRFPFVFSAQ